MKRVHVICEGQTEETFVAEVLAPALMQQQIYLLPSLIGKPGHKGGNLRFERLLTDVRARLGDNRAWCTTFFDFYGLPPEFPGKAKAEQQLAIADKAACIAQGLKRKLAEKLDANALRRFIPYVQMHEFEGLLFSSPEQLAKTCNRPAMHLPLQAIRDQFASPEHINDSPHTAPAKRILQLYPGYDKPLHGTIAALETGLGIMRRECRLFNGWLVALEKVGELGGG
jgi:hypothetical protein